MPLANPTPDATVDRSFLTLSNCWPGIMWQWISSLFQRKESGRLAGRSDERPSHYQELYNQLAAVEFLAVRAVGLIGALTLAFAAGVKTGQLSDAFFMVAFGFVASACAAGAGGLLGFVFGIPRLLQHADNGVDDGDPAGAADTKSRVAAKRLLRGNSNLEQISDWLTKILVGLTLVHLGSIYSGIKTLYTALKEPFNGTAAELPPDLAATFLLLLGGAMAFVGFLFLYVETRTRVTLLLNAVESLGDVPGDVVRKVAATATSFETARDGQAPALTRVEPIAEDAKILQHGKPDKAAPVGHWIAWAKATSRDQRFKDAIEAWTWVSQIEPTTEALEELASVYRLTASPNDRSSYQFAVEALERARALAPNEAKRVDLAMQELMLAVEAPPPKGFERARRIGRQLISEYRAAEEGTVLWFLLCAEGQRHKWLLQQASPQHDIDEQRERVLRTARTFVDKVPSLHDWRRQNACTSLASAEDDELDDLSSLASDKDLAAVLGCTHG